MTLKLICFLFLDIVSNQWPTTPTTAPSSLTRDASNPSIANNDISTAHQTTVDSTPSQHQLLFNRTSTSSSIDIETFNNKSHHNMIKDDNDTNQPQSNYHYADNNTNSNNVNFNLTATMTTSRKHQLTTKLAPSSLPLTATTLTIRCRRKQCCELGKRASLAGYKCRPDQQIERRLQILKTLKINQQSNSKDVHDDLNSDYLKELAEFKCLQQCMRTTLTSRTLQKCCRKMNFYKSTT